MYTEQWLFNLGFMEAEQSGLMDINVGMVLQPLC